MQITDYTFANITARPFLTLNDANNLRITQTDLRENRQICL